MKKTISIIICLLFLVMAISLVNAECTDSDGPDGNSISSPDKFIKGIVIENGTEHADTCWNGSLYHGAAVEGNGDSVGEYGCYDSELGDYVKSGGSLSFAIAKCEVGCQDGACIKAGTACTDSDGGEDYYVKGYATGLYAGEIKTIYDSCDADNPNAVVEAFCEPYGLEEGITQYGYICPNGCSDGACIKKGAGGCINKGERFSDTTMPNCCEGLTAGFVAYVSGYCLKEPLCGDGYCITMGEEDPTSCPEDCLCEVSDKGSAISSAFDFGSERDVERGKRRERYNSCADENNLKKYYCFSDYLASTNTILCENGCKDGVCIQKGTGECLKGGEGFKDTTMPNCCEGLTAVFVLQHSGYCLTESVCGDGICAMAESCAKDCEESKEPVYTHDTPLKEGESITINSILITVIKIEGEDVTVDIGGTQEVIYPGSPNSRDYINGIRVWVAGFPLKNGITYASIDYELQAPEELIPYKEIKCPEGTNVCPDGECRKNCEETPIPVEECKYGCIAEDQCIPVGYRKGTSYCDVGNNITEQKESGSLCDNSFECQSNVCAGGKCVSMSLIQKIIDWFKALFGIK